MEEVSGSTQLDNVWDLVNLDMYKELRSLRESLDEVRIEARQSSSFCERIQKDVAEFVRSEELTRQGDSLTTDAAMDVTSLQNHLMEFERYIIGKVREEIRNAGAGLPSQPVLDSDSSYIGLLWRRQEEQAARLEALLAESVLRESTSRREVKRYARQLQDRILNVEDTLETLTGGCRGRSAGGEGATNLAREVLKALTQLSEGLSLERETHEMERGQWFALMECAVEKIRYLSERESVLSEELQNLKATVLHNGRKLREMASVGDTPTERYAADAVTLSQHREGTQCKWDDPAAAQTSGEEELGIIRREISVIEETINVLRTDWHRHDAELDCHASKLAELDGEQRVLTNTVNKVGDQVKQMSQDIRSYSNVLRQSIKDEDRRSVPQFSSASAVLPDRTGSRSVWKALAQLLQQDTRKNMRSNIFHLWLSWVRGSTQLRRDEKILRLFTKQHKQLGEMSQFIQNQQETTEHQTLRSGKRGKNKSDFGCV